MKIKLTNENDRVVIEKSNGTSSEVATKADISAITKSDIGLGNVDNTADANKRVAYATSADTADNVDGHHASEFMAFSDHTNYVAARFLDENLSNRAHSTYIEWWNPGNNAGWCNFKVGDLTSNGTLKVGDNNVIHEGNVTPSNGSILRLESFPRYDDFPGQSTDLGTYLQSICKWAIDKYGNSGYTNITLMGSASPSVSGTLILHLYSHMGKDSTTGLPRYCSGQYEDLSGVIVTFGTNEYTWYSNIVAMTFQIPTVYSWAQQSTKPTYTASEVGISSSVRAITSNTSSSCSITGSSNAGKSQTIIYTNSTSSNLTVTVPTTYKTPDGAAIELTCKAGGYCEVNYLNIGGTIYARGL